MRILIVKAGSTVAPVRARRGDFEDWFRAGLGMGAEEAPCVAPCLGESLPAPEEVEAAIVTGSPAMVTDEAPWSVALEGWLRELVRLERPVLGVCYGHQLLAKACGGRVADHPRGTEVGTVRVALTPEGRAEPLFEGLPAGLDVHQSHRQSVLVLPPGARHLAGGAHDPHQAFALGPRAFGLQFHPEFDADITRGYLSARADALRAEGLDVDALLAAVRDSESGARILTNFRRLAAG